MKTLSIYLITSLISLLFLSGTIDGGKMHSSKDNMNSLSDLNDLRDNKLITLYGELDLNVAKRDNIETCTFLLNKLEIEEKIWLVENEADLQFTKLRYKKGIELIKMLYEKILGLDHHFTSLQTFKNISDLTNPNSFPEFVKRKDEISSRLNKKKSISMPALFETNPFVSLTTTIVSSLLGDGDKSKKEDDLDKVACVLDFTVKMHADLNTIFYETEFLKQSNLSLKTEALTLFGDYCKVIDYHTELSTCRSQDDWDNLFNKLDATIIDLEQAMYSQDSYQRSKYIKQLNNLEFSIDRLLTFIDSYSNFIKEGEKYYTKFSTILNSYSNEANCLEYLPHQFQSLKSDVDLSIAKFGEAYSVSEIQGSKLRDLLYGIPD